MAASNNNRGKRFFEICAIALVGLPLSWVSSTRLAARQGSNAPAVSPPAGQAPGAPPAARGFGFRGADPIDFNDHNGFVSLFDGATLNGWDGDKNFWSVKDGAIYVEPTCEKPTGTIYLIWQGGDAGEFEFKLQMKGTGNVNSGVQYRSWMTADPNSPKFPRPTPPPAPPAGARGAAGAPPPGFGRGPQCANPGTPPSAASEAKWDMGGPQYDFNENGRFSGQFYEQSTGRGIVALPGQVVEADPGQHPRLLATLGDAPTVASWFNKDDWNQEIIIARGHTYTHILNGHVSSVFIDNDPKYFQSTGKIGIEVESTGPVWVKDIWLKKY